MEAKRTRQRRDKDRRTESIEIFPDRRVKSEDRRLFDRRGLYNKSLEDLI